MNIEFHYYTIYFLAKNAGFTTDESEILAHASQFVDVNIIPYTILTSTGLYQTKATQNYSFWDKDSSEDIYIPFHFFPSGETLSKERRDQKTNLFNCTANSKNVKTLLFSALKSRNLYRIGIALHTFADSFAHQNFSGYNDEWNRLNKRSVIPPVGHAQALKKPDKLELIWDDSRLESSEVNNRERFFMAASKVYKYLCTFRRENFDDEKLILSLLEEIIGSVGREHTMEDRILNFQLELHLEKYNRKLWLNEALIDPLDPGEEELFQGYSKVLWMKENLFHRYELFERKTVKAQTNFVKSHFYHWYEAAKTHKQVADSILSPLYEIAKLSQSC